MKRISFEAVTHISLVGVGGGGDWGGRGGVRSRRDNCLTRALQGDWEISQHGGVCYRRELMVT